MRRSFFVSAALVASLVASAFTAPPVQATTCQELLDNNSYSCLVKTQDGAAFLQCVQFTSGGPDVLGVTSSSLAGSCSCLSKGRFTDPHFDQSKEFHCSGSGSLVGKVLAGGMKLEGEFILDGSSFSYVIECTLGCL